VIETIENFRDLTSWILDLYLSTISNKMNEVMKVLTVFAAIFIPLTFIAWVYWMNFKFMPELEWKYAYPVWWSIIIILTIIMLILFKKKKWL
jgi:magnesium transporter